MFEFCRGGQGDLDIISTFNEPFIWWELWRCCHLESGFICWRNATRGYLPSVMCTWPENSRPQHSVDLSAEKQNKKFGAEFFIMKNFSHFLLREFDDINKFYCVVDGHGVPSGWSAQHNCLANFKQPYLWEHLSYLLAKKFKHDILLQYLDILFYFLCFDSFNTMQNLAGRHWTSECQVETK